MDEQVCAWCEAETADGETAGWKEEEFGWKCPECRVDFADDSLGTTVGIEAFEAILNGEESK